MQTKLFTWQMSAESDSKLAF